MKIAHLSDLHFSKISLHPSQFFSKRWIGNLNLLCSRKKNFADTQIFSLIPLFQELKIDYVLITGDLSTTSLEGEFERASQFIEALKEKGIKVLVLPGNHDHYTKKAYSEKVFYNYFPANFSPELLDIDLRKEGITLKSLQPGWWLVALDTALATSLISSRGCFSPQLEKHLHEVLARIPREDRVLLANHFPLFQSDGPRKALKRADALQKSLKGFPNIKFYLHGHTHRHSIADLRVQRLPIVLDSGSAAHRTQGYWNLLHIDEQRCLVDVFHHKEKWHPIKQLAFELS